MAVPNPTFSLQGPKGLVTGYVIALAANTPAQLPAPGNAGTGGPTQPWHRGDDVNEPGRSRRS